VNLPPHYDWLNSVEGKPKIVVEALALFGVHEAPGDADNPQILAWAREVGLAGSYPHDSTAWCGLFMALVAHRAGKSVVAAPLWALNWRAWEAPSPEPSLGDVLVFTRDGGGHVGIYAAEDETAFHVLGGNEQDQVNIVRCSKDRFVACRRPVWKVAQPAGVRPFHVSSMGKLSTNEA
jgi:uncharacterized protein (TIGR02594 family)